MSYGKRSIAILGAGFLVLGVALMWFLSNFFYDLFWAFLDGYHVRQADVIAYTMAHLIPFVLSAIIIAGIWFALRWELSREHQSVRAVDRGEQRAAPQLYDGEKKRPDNLAEELEKRHTPHFIGRIEQTLIGEANGDVTCTLNVSVRNTGAPSIVDGWRVALKKHEIIYPCEMFMIPKGLTLESDNKSDPPTILTPADAIFDKTATTPIQAGGQARGWIFSIVRGIKREDLSDGTTIKIWFQDVLGKSYSATHVLAKEQIGPPKYYPDGSGGLRRSIEKSGC